MNTAYFLLKRSLSRAFLAAFFLLPLFSSGCATPYSGPVTATSSGLYTPYAMPRNVTHEVGPSETLWRISKTYEVPVEDIMRANRLSNADKIKTGQRLVIPGTKGPRLVIPLYPSQQWTHIVIHHTVTHNGNARTIDAMHRQRGFWNGLGYHFLVDNGTNNKVAGQIEVGPRWVKQKNGAHANANGMNERGIGIALIGNFSERYVPNEQFDSLVVLVRTLQKYYKIPDNRVIRHSDVPGKNTECPGLKFPWTELQHRIS